MDGGMKIVLQIWKNSFHIASKIMKTTYFVKHINVQMGKCGISVVVIFENLHWNTKSSQQNNFTYPSCFLDI